MSDFLKNLTASDITSLIANQRTRGGIEATLKEFAASGELYKVLSELPQYSEKTKEQLQATRNQLTMKAKALDMTNIKLVKTEDNFLLVNTDFLTDEDSE